MKTKIKQTVWLIRQFTTTTIRQFTTTTIRQFTTTNVLKYLEQKLINAVTQYLVERNQRMGYVPNIYQINKNTTRIKLLGTCNTYMDNSQWIDLNLNTKISELKLDGQELKIVVFRFVSSSDGVGVEHYLELLFVGYFGTNVQTNLVIDTSCDGCLCYIRNIIIYNYIMLMKKLLVLLLLASFIQLSFLQITSKRLKHQFAKQVKHQFAKQIVYQTDNRTNHQFSKQIVGKDSRSGKHHRLKMKMKIKKYKSSKEFYNIKDCKMEKYSKENGVLRVQEFEKKGERKFTTNVDFYSKETKQYCRDIHKENCSEMMGQIGVDFKQIQESEDKKFKYELSIYLQFKYDDEDQFCHVMLYDVEDIGDQDQLLKFKKKVEEEEEEEGEEGEGEGEDKKDEKKRAKKTKIVKKVKKKNTNVKVIARFRKRIKKADLNATVIDNKSSTKISRKKKDKKKKKKSKKGGKKLKKNKKDDEEKKEGEEGEEEDEGPTDEEKAEFAKEIQEKQEQNNEECAEQFFEVIKEGEELEELSSDYKDNFVKKYIMQFMKKEEQEEFDSNVICPGNIYFLQKNRKQKNE